MKRGFLNTEKAISKLPDVPITDQSDPKDNEKGKAKLHSDISDPMSSLPLLSLHVVPQSVRVDGHKRFIFRTWPRDPNGRPILPSDIHGKEAGNGLDLWGATLYDFYFVHRIPDNKHALTISTGSKLSKVMKEFGELDHARDELAWAAREAQPMEIPALDPVQAIEGYERRVRQALWENKHKRRKRAVRVEAADADFDDEDAQMTDASEPVGPTVEEAGGPASGDRTNGPNGDSTDAMGEDGMEQIQSAIPVESPFHPSHYPPEWPSPFESPTTLYALQRRIPIHLLPKKLYVHDPWKLADTGSVPIHSGESWTSKVDHVHAYSLSLPFGLECMAETASEAAAVAEDEALKNPETVFIPPPVAAGPTEQPAIRAILPRRPRRPSKIPEAHLYLSPEGELGSGNHSIVYEAELELPRDLFCKAKYCTLCLDDQVKIEVNRLKASGEWEQRLNKAVQEYATESRRSASSPSVQVAPPYVGFVKVIVEHKPMETAEVVGSSSLMENPATDCSFAEFVRVSEPLTRRYTQYEGPVVSVYPDVQWQNPNTPCKHNDDSEAPRTARFRVAAKLSLPHDPHLEREARNYAQFPEHFFQHWTGYNVVPPLHDPTPIGALVPQFFGYYTPDDETGPDEDNYYSPILLVEHCGKPIRVSKLSIDERHECAALLFRFHAAGWYHGSFSERNILLQRGHPTCDEWRLGACLSCAIPHLHRRYSFRLIDFGRSQETKSSMRSLEEMEGKELFGIL